MQIWQACLLKSAAGWPSITAREGRRQFMTSATKQPYVKYHKDGSPWAKGQLVDGVPEGYWEWFRKDGSKMRSGFFTQGKQTGEWTTYDRKSKVYKITRIR